MGGIIVQKNRCGMKKTEREAKKSVSSNAGQAIPKRILVADDNKVIQVIVSEFLELLGYEVALAVFLASTFDLVLTDLEMPVMDGLSLAGHIKARSPSTPVILLTGADRETVRKKVEKGPVDSVIFKPFMLEDLQRTVQGA
jgi:two-component system, chemotaxis family, chemotaxis protein CheY